MELYQYIKICVCLSVCVTEVGCSEGGTTVVTRDLRTYYTRYFVLITSGCTQGVAAEEDAGEEEQLKQTQSGSCKLKRMQSRNSSSSGCIQGAVWSDHTRLVLARDTTAQDCWCTRLMQT